MANNFESNFTRKLAEGFMPAFENERVLSKNVNTQLLDGKFTPNSGANVDFKRPTDTTTIRSANGDITGQTGDNIITGKATGTVQDYFTAYVSYDEADEAIQMGNVEELLKPYARRIVTDYELDFAGYMMRNGNLLAGAPGTAVTTWAHVAEAGAVMSSSGVPKDNGWCYTVNPYAQVTLSNDQRSIGAPSSSSMISEAHRKAIITDDFAGMKVMTATTLDSFTIAAGADRAGTLTAAPTPTYLAAKDTMTQTLAVTAFQANLVVKAGETIQVAGSNRLNLSTRKPIVDGAGANILFTGTVQSDVTLGVSGEGNIVIAGAGIYEATGAYNTIDAALANGAVVTLLGSAADVIQPNLFWHRDAFSVGSVPIKKLHSHDTVATTSDGLQIRVSKGADFLGNEQMVRFDFRPAFATINPFWAGQGHG